jgi:hypothetical protein
MEGMMLYMCLICYDPAQPLEPSGPLGLQPKHAEYEETLRERGIYAGGAALMPPTQVPPVRVKDGVVLATDGPFAETKEVLGGYYVIDAPGMDEATKLAAGIPVDSRSWVEVRPVVLWHPK